MRDVFAVVIGAVVAFGLLVGLSFLLTQLTGRPLGASAYLLISLVLFPLCVGVSLTVAKRRAEQRR